MFENCHSGLNAMYRITVIEDTASEIELLKIGLNQAGVAYELSVFPAGDVAMEFLSTTPLRPDLVVTDVNLPRVNIEELLEQFATLKSIVGVAVVVMSGMDDSRTIGRMLRCGAADYIVKPYHLHEWVNIGKRLKKIIEGASGGYATKQSSPHQ